MKNLEILKAWSNSEVKLKQEQQNLQIQEMQNGISKKDEELMRSQIEIAGLVDLAKTELPKRFKEERAELKQNYHLEIKSLQDSKESSINKYKSEVNGLRSKLVKSQRKIKLYRIYVTISLMLMIVSVLIIWNQH